MKTVVKLSSYPLTLNQNYVLFKGLKSVSTPRRIPKAKIISAVDSSIRTPKFEEDKIYFEAVKMLRTVKPLVLISLKGNGFQFQ